MYPHDLGKRVFPVDKAYFEKLSRYFAIMLHADRMRTLGLISDAEHLAVSTKIADYCGLSGRCIFRENNLIFSDTRGNMPANKEVGLCQES